MDKQVFNSMAVTDFFTRNVEVRPGELRWKENKCYRFVYNAAAEDMVVGRVYYAGAAAAADEFAYYAYKFGQSSKSTAINFPLGIAVSAIPSTYYGWLQCYGEGTIGIEGTSAVAIADSLKGVSGQTYMVKDVATGTAPTVGVRQAFALAAQGSAGVTNTRAWIQML